MLEKSNIPFVLIIIGFLGGVVDNRYQIYCLLTLFLGILMILIQDTKYDKLSSREDSTETLVDQ